MTRPAARSPSEHSLSPRYERLVRANQVAAERAGSRGALGARQGTRDLLHRVARAPIWCRSPECLQEATRDRGLSGRGREECLTDSPLRRGGCVLSRERAGAYGKARSPAVGSGWADCCHRSSQLAGGRDLEREGLSPIPGSEAGGLVSLSSPLSAKMLLIPSRKLDSGGIASMYSPCTPPAGIRVPNRTS